MNLSTTFLTFSEFFSKRFPNSIFKEIQTAVPKNYKQISHHNEMHHNEIAVSRATSIISVNDTCLSSAESASPLIT